MSRITESNTGKQAEANLGQAAAHVGQNLREVGSQVRDAASEKYTELRDQAASYYEHGRERAHEWEQSVETYIKEKPLQAVMIAAGVGVLLGLLWRRR